MSSPWFAKSEAEAARDVTDIVRSLWETEGRSRLAHAENCLQLYMGSTRHSLSGMSSPLSLLELADEPCAYNVIQAIADTKIAHTYRNKVRPLYLTEGGDSELREKAQAQQDAIEGLFYEYGIYEDLGLAVCANGYLFEAGGVEFTPDPANNRVLCDAIWPWDYFVLKREARTGRPRQVFARAVVDRAVLLAFCKDAPRDVRAAIEEADAVPYEDAAEDYQQPGSVADQVCIFKAWHLPSGRVDLGDPRSFGKGETGRRVDPGHDGRHVVAIESKSGARILTDSPWPWDHFPQSWFRPARVPGSFWSRGIPEQLARLQLASNRWNKRIDRILDLHARPLLVKWKRAGINAAQITNALASILESDVPPGQAIMPLQTPATPPELVKRVGDLPMWAREQLGMSEMSMRAQKPPGVNHLPGLQHLADVESIRHNPEFRAWERFHIDSARNLSRCLRMLAETDPDFELLFEKDAELRRAKWKEIGDDYERFRVKAWPSNLFANTPTARAAQVIEFAKEMPHIFTPEVVLQIIDAPDLKAAIGDQIAVARNIEKKLDRVQRGEDGAELMPHAHMNLELAKTIALRRVNKLEADGEPWDRIQHVIQWLEDVDEVMARIAPPPPPPAPDAGMMPPGGAPPMMPPEAMPPPAA